MTPGTDFWLCDSVCGGAGLADTNRGNETHPAKCVSLLPQGFGGREMIFIGRAVGTTPSDTEQAALDHWASYLNPAVLARLPPANFTLPNAPLLSCTNKFCAADGRFYPSRCGGDGTGMGTSGDLATAAANGCRVVFADQPGIRHQILSAVCSIPPTFCPHNLTHSNLSALI